MSASALSLAADGRFYDPRNAASPTGFTIGYELFRTIGCPGRGLLDTPCPVEETTGSPAPAIAETPAPTMTDSDGDGVEDERDKCPDTPKGWKINADGCPQDTDGDGVADNIDRCPKVFAQTADGCPEVPTAPPPAVLTPLAPTYTIPATLIPPATPAAMPALTPASPDGDYFVGSATGPIQIPRKLVFEGVNFESGRAALRKEDIANIDKDVLVLKDWGDLKIEVSGHTDSIGSESYNQALSLRRANAVRDYLISKGIPADRLIAKGYGEAEPVESNETEEGRFKNRRVELNQISE
ncbi:MAG: OmpA family protein [Thiobacillus sp.]